MLIAGEGNRATLRQHWHQGYRAGGAPTLR